MTNVPVPIELDKTIALDWLRYSLGQGEVISPAALKFIEAHEGHGYTLAPETVDRALLADPSDGAVITPGTGSPREALARVLTTLTERGAACVVVEDELGLKRDAKPGLDGPLLTGFVGEKVIHWANLAGGTDDAVIAVDRGSGDYPTNAFVTSVSAEELGLVDGADLESDIAGAVVVSLVAVIMAAYDAETYIIWEPS
jgi:CBS domain-containing protein